MRILREPLLHFAILGSLVYATAAHFNGESTRYEIDAGPEQRSRLARTYLEQYGVPPTPSQLERVLDEYVRSEILYREGLAMGLEQNDEIVRRRVVQKIEFVNEDLDAEALPDDAGLAAFFAQHRDRYDTEPTVSFEQVFYSADRGGEAVAKRRAEGALASQVGVAGGARGFGGVASGAGAATGVDAPRGVGGSRGDTFADGREIHALSRTGANRLFGDTELSAGLFATPVGKWAGPFKSAYGWHVVRITVRQPARPAELDAVRVRVRSDYLADLREKANTQAFSRIASKYRVVTDGPRAVQAGAAAMETPPAALRVPGKPPSAAALQAGAAAQASARNGTPGA